MDIRTTTDADRPGWEALYAGYAAFYNVSQTPRMRDTVWGWIAAGRIEARVAVQGDALIGLAHFRSFARPLSASTGGFLDDLFVAPEARGSGAAAALIAAVRAEAMARGWTVLRWITAEDNHRARGLYDKVAQKTAWVTYDIRL